MCAKVDLEASQPANEPSWWSRVVDRLVRSPQLYIVAAARGLEQEPQEAVLPLSGTEVDLASAMRALDAGTYTVSLEPVNSAAVGKLNGKLAWSQEQLAGAQCRQDDLVVVFLSSHGSPREKDTAWGVNYVITSDTDVKDADSLFATAMPMVELADVVRTRIRARWAPNICAFFKEQSASGRGEACARRANGNIRRHPGWCIARWRVSEAAGHLPFLARASLDLLQRLHHEIFPHTAALLILAAEKAGNKQYEREGWKESARAHDLGRWSPLTAKHFLAASTKTLIRVGSLGMPAALPHRRDDLAFHAVLGELNLAVGRNIEIHQRRLPDGRNHVVLVHPALYHFNHLLITESRRGWPFLLLGGRIRQGRLARHQRLLRYI